MRPCSIYFYTIENGVRDIGNSNLSSCLTAVGLISENSKYEGKQRKQPKMQLDFDIEPTFKIFTYEIHRLASMRLPINEAT